MKTPLHADILVIDVETTGLDPARHACIELGAVLLDRELNPVAEFSSLVAPWDSAEIMSEALAVNQINPAALKSAPQVPEVVDRFHQAFRPDSRKLLLCGWNVWLDVAFLKGLYARANCAWPFGHRLLDIQSVVTFHSQLMPKSQADTIKRFLNDEQSHRALPDARQTAALLRLFAQQQYEPHSGNIMRL
jgi:DNA polymerase III epsilon subunit-like protein